MATLPKPTRMAPVPKSVQELGFDKKKVSPSLGSPFWINLAHMRQESSEELLKDDHYLCIVCEFEEPVKNPFKEPTEGSIPHPENPL